MKAIVRLKQMSTSCVSDESSHFKGGVTGHPLDGMEGS
jgi:hypothetical protein